MASQAVGMIGLGSLGGAMARRLVSLGWAVHGYDTDSARLSAAVAAGVEAAASPAAVAAACDRVILSLPDSDAVEAVCLGQTGLIHAARAQLLVVDTTSGYPMQTRAVASALAGQGIRMPDAAISAPGGGATAAQLGQLTFMVGAADARYAAAGAGRRTASRRLHAGASGGLARRHGRGAAFGAR